MGAFSSIGKAFKKVFTYRSPEEIQEQKMMKQKLNITAQKQALKHDLSSHNGGHKHIYYPSYMSKIFNMTKRAFRIARTNREILNGQVPLRYFGNFRPIKKVSGCYYNVKKVA